MIVAAFLLGIIVGAILQFLVVLWLARRQPSSPKTVASSNPKMAPLPVDPDNPPTWKYYRPSRRGGPVLRCVCHDRPLVEGQRILWWPLPDSEAVHILCEDAELASSEGKGTP